MAKPVSRTTLRDQMSDKRPYMSWPTVEVLWRISIFLCLVPEIYVHEVAIGNPRYLLRRAERPSDDVETDGQRRLVHEGQEVNTCAC